ncbi:formimidoylglutamate deiminase [Vibrio sp.]|uniref:Formimidoylglutamate deiminase n=1 Tax=Vibrio viridaestus TaxID=2487322 RepID=A0A3N9TGK9_9VIBR|nr:formimidoylglutamate deiminase [Vibrio viridaestus]MDC0609593.1 formimidoylglutamate deiminase [Vibrio sp.]RQW63309.1 formimidoylglutamate deiminase [Vibrio viridaestus]
MKRFFMHNAFIQDRWQKDVIIDLDEQGVIRQVSANNTFDVNATEIKGLVLPSMSNLHSHAFQRAMAGLAEVAGDPQDSFWTWREQMYHLVERLSPEQVKTIASYLYIDMLKGGYTQVAEFNYLHHDQSGTAYESDDMSVALRDAALQAGIGQTLLPVLYTYSGFGDLPAQPLQKRFIQTTDQYIAQCQALCKSEQGLLTTGICFHSLRAVNIDQIKQVLARLSDNAPVHIHISEQMKEVNDCLSWSGKRPVEYLYDNISVDKRWCLIHATHLNDSEVSRIADSGAIAGICTTTEANLGDGIFPATDFIQQGGLWGVGSDSHVSLNAMEELRWLEYGQRLVQQKRNRMVTDSQKSVGELLWIQAAKGGAQACGVDLGCLDVGYRADWLELKSDEWLTNLPSEQWINRWLFGGDKTQIESVYVAGKRVIHQGSHQAEKRIKEEFAAVMAQLSH